MRHNWYTQYLNSLWPSYATWRNRSGSTLAEVGVSCLAAPSHYMKQWLFSWLMPGNIHLRAVLTRDTSALHRVHDRNTMKNCWFEKTRFVPLCKFCPKMVEKCISFRYEYELKTTVESINLLYKHHNSPVPCSTMHQFITKMSTILLQNRALWVISLMHCRICEIDQLLHNFTLLQLLPIKSHKGLTAILDPINGSDW